MGKTQARCSKGCTTIESEMLLQGTRNTADFSMSKKKKLEGLEANLCIETWHFTVATRGQTHKRTSTKSSQNLCEWRKPQSSWKILSLLRHINWYLHQAPQTYLSHILWSGKRPRRGRRALSALGLESCSGTIGLLPNIVIKSGTAGVVLKLKCGVSLAHKGRV